MLAAYIDLILLVSGLVTMSVLTLFLAPVTMLKLIFGQAPTDTLSPLLVRHYAVLGCAVGVLLICAAYHAENRVPVLIIAAVEKAVFALGMLSSPFRRRPAVLVVALADAVIAVILCLYLIGL